MDKLSIGAVARMTGLTEFTLRAWERRYKAVKPERLVSGRRVYSREDVEKLGLLQKLTSQGIAIGDVAQLSVNQLTDFVQRERGSAAVANGSAIGLSSARENVDDMLEAVRSLNVGLLTALLKSRQMQYNTRSFLVDIVAVFLRELGEQVNRGTLDVYHEHLASAVVRNHLTGILFATEQTAHLAEAPPIIFATPEGDLHEFGILIAGLLTLMHGRRVLYLGANIPFGSLERAARLTKSRMIVLGVSVPESAMSDQDLTDFVKALSKRAPEDTKIWIGGERRHLFKKFRSGQVRLFDNLQEFDRAFSDGTTF